MKSFRIFSALVILITLVSFVPSSTAAEVALAAAPQAGPATADAAVPLNPFSTGPSYDSGWRNIAQGQTISMWHGLSGAIPNYFVDLQARRYGGVTGISNRFIGGNDQSGSEDRQGVYWHNLTGNSISVTRQEEDTLVDAVRVRIWVADGGADWSSGWTTIEPGHYQPFLFPLIANNPIENYVVDLMFLDSGYLGINQRAYGGRTLGTRSMPFYPGARVGAYWYGLGIGSVKVYRMPEDEYADQVLVRVWYRQLPTYESGWFTMNPNTSHIFTHNIGGNPDDYRVDMEFKTANSTWGINQCYFGGSDFHELSPFPPGYENDQMGAYWRNLDYDSISVYRLPEDAVCADQVRIRIWNFWTPTRPGYDSGWKSIIQGGSLLFEPNLGGNPDRYLVDLQFKDTGYPINFGINQRGLGGLDWTAGERQGGFWHFLYDGIVVYRALEDENANYVRARVWEMPAPAFDSQWQDISSNYEIPITHNLGGDPRDYLVDLQFKASGGFANQAGYGGYEVTNISDPDFSHRLGGFWQGMDDSHIHVRRGPEATDIDYVRVRIWTLARPDYDSGMVTPTADTTSLGHDLGARAENYFVSLMFNDPELKLLHHRYYGGAVIAYLPTEVPNTRGDRVGAYYRLLNSASVVVYRNPEEAYTDQFRMRLWVVKQIVYIPAVKK